MRTKILLLGYPQTLKKKLAKFQRRDFQKIISRARKQCSSKFWFEVKVGQIEAIDIDCWNLIFYDLHSELLSQLVDKYKPFPEALGGVFFMKSQQSWLEWKDNETYKKQGFIGFMGSQSTELLRSDSFRDALGVRIYPFAFVGLTEALQHLPGYKKEKEGTLEKYYAIPRKSVGNDNNQKFIYALHQPNSIYTQVTVNMWHIVDIFFSYLSTVDELKNKNSFSGCFSSFGGRIRFGIQRIKWLLNI